jgi:hypothetical protein
MCDINRSAHRRSPTCARNPECLHTGLLEVSGYPADTAVPSCGPRMVCSACGGKRINVRPNWKEQQERPTVLRND